MQIMLMKLQEYKYLTLSSPDLGEISFLNALPI